MKYKDHNTNIDKTITPSCPLCGEFVMKHDEDLLLYRCPFCGHEIMDEEYDDSGYAVELKDHQRGYRRKVNNYNYLNKAHGDLKKELDETRFKYNKALGEIACLKKKSKSCKHNQKCMFYETETI